MLPWQQLRARCCPGFLLLNTDHQSKENPWALCNLAQYKTPQISFLNKNSAVCEGHQALLSGEHWGLSA